MLGVVRPAPQHPGDAARLTTDSCTQRAIKIEPSVDDDHQDTLGALKIVAHADTGQVLGVHAALEGAGDLMLAATYAIKAGATVDDVADTWAPYLTTSEALRIAAGLYRDDMPTSCCA